MPNPPERPHPSNPDISPDIVVEDHGTILLVRPLSEQAALWISESVTEDAQYFGDSLVVEPRYIPDLIDGMAEAGLIVRGSLPRPNSASLNP